MESGSKYSSRSAGRKRRRDVSSLSSDEPRLKRRSSGGGGLSRSKSRGHKVMSRTDRRSGHKKRHTPEKRKRKLKKSHQKHRKKAVHSSSSDSYSDTKSDRSDSSFDSSSESSSSSHSEEGFKYRNKHRKAKKSLHHKCTKRELKHKTHETSFKPTLSAVIPSGSKTTISVQGKPTVQKQGGKREGSAAKQRGPMTREEWEKLQSVVRRVCDPDTGRHRLVKGDGEIVEEIVSREQQKNINKQATLGDSLSFQQGLRKLL